MYYFEVFYQYFTLSIGIVMIMRWYWVHRPALSKRTVASVGAGSWEYYLTYLLTPMTRIRQLGYLFFLLCDNNLN